MKVLITGGSGFLGRNLAQRLLARGDHVLVLCRNDYPELVKQGATLIRGNIANAQQVSDAAQNCDAIIHSAAKVGAWGTYRDFHSTNVVGTQNVIATCQSHGIQKLIYTSTPSVVHSGGDVQGGNESLPYATHFEAHYPKTKAIAEQLVLDANSSNLSTIALRPHLIWGPGDSQLLPRFVERYKAGRLRLCSGPPKRIDTLFIDNAVDAHLLALDRLAPESACAGRAYFISNGEPLPIDEVINGVLGTVGLGPVKKTIKPWNAFVAGAVAEGIFGALRLKREPPITRFVARQLSTAHWFDISAARRDLGYIPKVTFAEGLARMRLHTNRQ